MSENSVSRNKRFREEEDQFLNQDFQSFCQKKNGEDIKEEKEKDKRRKKGKKDPLTYLEEEHFT